MSIKHTFARWFKKTVLGFVPAQEHVAVGVRAPQDEIRVLLHGLGEPRDVTKNHSIASLRPWMVAVGFEPEIGDDKLQAAPLSLAFYETASDGRELGRIQLRFSRSIAHAHGKIGIFETTGHGNYCLSPLRLQMHYLYRRFEMRRRPLHNFQMDPVELQRNFIFYICPRPVILVSVCWQDAGNLFPMDLIGASAPNYFALALRSTSPSVRLMRESKRMALSNIPFEWKDIAYELGRQHRVERIDWDKLPFERMPSAEFGLPVPRAALSVREVCAEQVEVVGSHTFFITTIAREEQYASGLQLHHAHEFYEYYRAQHRQVRNG